jgi:hypothetical protein
VTLPLQGLVNASPLVEQQSGSPGQISFQFSIQIPTHPGDVPVIQSSVPPTLSLSGSQAQAPEELERSLKERLQRKKLVQNVEISHPNDYPSDPPLPTPSTSQSERWESDAANFTLNSTRKSSSTSIHPESSDASLQRREISSHNPPEIRAAVADSRNKSLSGNQMRYLSEKKESYRGDSKYRDIRYTPYPRTDPSYHRSQHYQVKNGTQQPYRRSVSPASSHSGYASSPSRPHPPLLTSSRREDERTQTRERDNSPPLDDQDMHSDASSESSPELRSTGHAEIERDDPNEEGGAEFSRRESSPISISHVKEVTDRQTFRTPSPRPSNRGLPCDNEEDHEPEQDRVSLRHRIQPATSRPQLKISSSYQRSACPFIHPTSKEKHPPHVPHPGYSLDEYHEVQAIYESGRHLPRHLIKSGAIVNSKKRKPRDIISPYSSSSQSRFGPTINDEIFDSSSGRDHLVWADNSKSSIAKRFEEREYRDGETRGYINVSDGNGRDRSENTYYARRGSYHSAPFRAPRPFNDYRRSRVDTYNN